MLAYTGISAQTVQEGQSWMNGRIGQQIMSPLVSIWDDGQDPGGVPMPFDFEGVPKKPVKIVEEGWIREPVYDHYTAHKEGKESTGHATPPNMAFIDGPMPANMFMAPGESSIEELIKSDLIDQNEEGDYDYDTEELAKFRVMNLTSIIEMPYMSYEFFENVLKKLIS